MNIIFMPCLIPRVMSINIFVNITKTPNVRSFTLFDIVSFICHEGFPQTYGTWVDASQNFWRFLWENKQSWSLWTREGIVFFSFYTKGEGSFCSFYPFYQVCHYDDTSSKYNISTCWISYLLPYLWVLICVYCTCVLKGEIELPFNFPQRILIKLYHLISPESQYRLQQHILPVHGKTFSSEGFRNRIVILKYAKKI